MDDSAIAPKSKIVVTKRQTQSLSPLSFNNFMTQKKKKQSHNSNLINSNDEFLNEKGILHNNFFDLNNSSLVSIFSNHPIAFRIVQELLLFHRPIPFAILMSLLNITFYFYRTLHFTFYSHAIFLLFIYILSKVFIPRIWPIVYETLFLNDNEIQRLKKMNHIPEADEENKEDSNKNSENNLTKDNDNNEEKTNIKHEKKEIDSRYDPKVLNHLRTPEEAAKAVFKYINPIRIFLKAFVLLTNDDSIMGLEIMVCIYFFFFCFAMLFDLFWPIVIFLNIILLAPGIYFNPQIRMLIIRFRKKWKV